MSTFFSVIGSSRRRSQGASDPYWSYVSCLLHMDGTDGSTTFTDSSPNGFDPTPSGNAHIDTADYKWGGASGVFDGTGDFITWSGSYDDKFAFNTGSFTIEFWAHMRSNASYKMLYDGRSANGNYPCIYAQSNGTIFYYVNSGNRIISTTNVFRTGSWYHIALAKTGSSTKLFVNGTQVGSTYTDNTYYSQSNLVRFARNAVTITQDYDGWFDDIRITKGICRYTANFTPPTEAFPNQ